MDEMRTNPKEGGGFTLVELLVVMTIIVILSTLSLPAFTTIIRGSTLTRAGQLISDQFALARQEAVTQNRDVQVRFYNLTSGVSTGWRGIQLLRIDQTPTGTGTTALSRVAVIPDGIVITTNLDSTNHSLSPLITGSNPVTLPGYGSASYSFFRFRANGSLENSVGATENYITLVNATGSGNPPANYYTIQINPLTGKTSVFRP